MLEQRIVKVLLAVILMAALAFAESDSKTERDLDASLSKEEALLTPCIDYAHGMEFDDTLRDDSRVLEQKSKCMAWCVDWVTHEWWEKCAWDRCKECTECENIDICRPLVLIPQAGCAAVFEPIAWSQEEISPEIATEKYFEFCQSKPYEVDFLGMNVGECEGQKCKCRKNPVCKNWEVTDEAKGNERKISMVGSCNVKPGANCCDADSCLQTFVRTELKEADEGGNLKLKNELLKCFKFFPSKSCRARHVPAKVF